MNTKLTLTIEDTTIKKAKAYAKGQGISLSKIIENYLKTISRESVPTGIKITPIVKSLKGAFKAPRNFDYKEQLSETINDKYLR